MAQKVQVVLVDDLDGSAGPTVETVSFGLDGTHYEIDLSKKNATKFRKQMEGYTQIARKANGARPKPKARQERTKTPGAIRVWANNNGIEVPAHGRIPKAVVEQYQAAH